MKQHQWNFRLSDGEKAKADYLVRISAARSREQWFVDLVTEEAAREVERIDLSLAAFNAAVRAAADRADDCLRDGDAIGAAIAKDTAASYRREIDEYMAKRLILIQAEDGAKP